MGRGGREGGGKGRGREEEDIDIGQTNEVFRATDYTQTTVVVI